MRRMCALLVLAILPPAVLAGEAGPLPDTEAGFKRRIESLIRPGHGLEDALRLLEAQRFECMEFETRRPVFHCSRLEPPAGGVRLLYQVMIEPRGAQVKSVEPSLGRLR